MLLLSPDNFESFAKPYCLSATAASSSELRFQPRIGDIVLLKHTAEGILSGRACSMSSDTVTIELHLNHELFNVNLPLTKVAAVVLGD